MSSGTAAAPAAGAEARWRPAQRLGLHLLLAIFVARANNELYEGFIAWEEKHGFYQAILELHGNAPDQYRLLPLLPLGLFEHWFRYRVALMAVNFLAFFATLELFAWMLRHRPERQRAAFSMAFSGLVLYSLYPGWRPDTFSLLALCTLSLVPLVAMQLSNKRSALMVAAIAVVAFARADMAFAYGIFLQARRRLSRWAAPLVLLLPLVIQAVLARVVFPEATYYMKVWTITDNLSLHIILRTSVTYLLLALLLYEWGSARRWLTDAWRYDRALLGACAAYFVAVLCLGRVNEYRLFLPFVPMFLIVDRERFERRAAAAV